MSEGKESNEYIITRHNQFAIPINVINVYSEQECRTPFNIVNDHWNALMEEIIKIEAKNELVIMVGDFNKHIGNVVKDNHDKVTAGGKLVREFLLNEKYVLLNSCDMVENGPFTRIDPSDPNNNERKSCLDLVIMSKYLMNIFNCAIFCILFETQSNQVIFSNGMKI